MTTVIAGRMGQSFSQKWQSPPFFAKWMKIHERFFSNPAAGWLAPAGSTGSTIGLRHLDGPFNDGKLNATQSPVCSCIEPYGLQSGHRSVSLLHTVHTIR
jgi:hypothetical protein